MRRPKHAFVDAFLKVYNGESNSETISRYVIYSNYPDWVVVSKDGILQLIFYKPERYVSLATASVALQEATNLILERLGWEQRLFHEDLAPVNLRQAMINAGLEEEEAYDGA